MKMSIKLIWIINWSSTKDTYCVQIILTDWDTAFWHQRSREWLPWHEWLAIRMEGRGTSSTNPATNGFIIRPRFINLSSVSTEWLADTKRYTRRVDVSPEGQPLGYWRRPAISPSDRATALRNRLEISTIKRQLGRGRHSGGTMWRMRTRSVKRRLSGAGDKCSADLAEQTRPITIKLTVDVAIIWASLGGWTSEIFHRHEHGLNQFTPWLLPHLAGNRDVIYFGDKSIYHRITS